MLILNAQEARQALPMREVVEAMKQAYAALSAGQADVPLRTRISIPRREALAIFMPAYAHTPQADALAAKIVNIYPQNPARGMPYIQAAVVVFDAETGKVAALLEGNTLTAIRTGAGSGAAIDLLAREDSRTVIVFGAGAQGRAQLEAACAVRAIEKAWIADPHPERIEAFIADMAGRAGIPAALSAATDARAALREADIVCAATTSKTPVFSDADLKRGAHISAIGSYTPQMQETPPETILRASVFVDSRSAVLAESGDLIQPIQSGLISEAHIRAELGDVILGKKVGRTSSDEITYFKSVGVAVQDALAAQVALKNAQALGLGQTVEF